MLPWISEVFNHEWAYKLVTVLPQTRFIRTPYTAFTCEAMEYVVIVGYKYAANDYVCARVWRHTIESGNFIWDSGNYHYDYDKCLEHAVKLAMH